MKLLLKSKKGKPPKLKLAKQHEIIGGIALKHTPTDVYDKAHRVESGLVGKLKLKTDRGIPTNEKYHYNPLGVDDGVSSERLEKESKTMQISCYVHLMPEKKGARVSIDAQGVNQPLLSLWFNKQSKALAVYDLLKPAQDELKYLKEKLKAATEKKSKRKETKK